LQFPEGLTDTRFKRFKQAVIVCYFEKERLANTRVIERLEQACWLLLRKGMISYYPVGRALKTGVLVATPEGDDGWLVVPGLQGA
jgi:hypothetical protein